MPKHCVFSDCKSDSRFHPWLKFAAFVKPTKAENIERAKRWIYLLDREDFGVEKINKDTYIDITAILLLCGMYLTPHIWPEIPEG